jgi:hypothetical protein
MTVGDCFPSCSRPLTCVSKRIPATLVVVTGTLSAAPGPSSGGCQMEGIPAGPWITGRFAPLDTAVARVDLAATSTFGISLDAGAYSLAVVDSTGCGWCVSGWQSDGGVDSCVPNQVRAGEVTKTDVFELFASG